MFALWHDSARGLSQPWRHMEHNICVTHQTFHTQTRDKCRQSRPATRATPIVPLKHTRFVYTPERQTCLHTGPQWAPGNRERRKDVGYCECSFCNTSNKGWSVGGSRHVSTLLFIHTEGYCIGSCRAGLLLKRTINLSPPGNIQSFLLESKTECTEFRMYL